ncbi:rhomboid family intramembrane serine protease [Brumimicrobium aurantiacum]|uniref:Rhomboid family intramembrane serine protease n=1 Tax=Brumimicrobium aurantiacum TaxID=1737063 RepID=A0A3E1EZG2_9FLAO|nr:rhomboid family intramembrane serine protease [Brumimicrobium aurantiacum]RFC54962.1 rhomboid family intramembrane serine protease [Brumimicrobium aurantiacum]
MELINFPVTIAIIIATVIISLKAFKDAEMKYKWIFYPYKVNHNNEFYRILSHVFIHGDMTHLFFNMFVLFSFGQNMEYIFIHYFGEGLGSVHFFLLYFLGGLAASLWPYTRNYNNPNYMSLGASGAVSAVLFASILWMPEGGIYLLFIPFEIPAWLFGILYLAFEYYMSKKGGTGIAHDAHFGGAIFGIIYVLLINFSKGSEFFEYILS